MPHLVPFQKGKILHLNLKMRHRHQIRAIIGPYHSLASREVTRKLIFLRIRHQSLATVKLRAKWKLWRKRSIISGVLTLGGSFDFDNLTNLPQVIMPLKFKSLAFVKYDGIRDPYAHLHMFCRKMAPYGDN